MSTVSSVAPSRRRFLKWALAAGVGSIARSVIPDHAGAQTRGGTLREYTEEPVHLNPAIMSGVDTGRPGTQIFAGLILQDDKFNPRPYLAERWTISPDERTFTFYLRRGPTFHDGTPITSHDVKFSAETVKAHHPFGATIYRALEAIDTPDSRTVTFRFSSPFPAFMSAAVPLLLPVLPKHIYSTGDILRNPANLKPVGSGPFRFIDWKKGQSITVERNPRFFLPGRPYLDRIIFVFITDPAARSAAFEQGALDVGSYSPVSLVDTQRMEKLPHLAVETRGYEAIGGMLWIEFNLRRKELSDVRVRRAFAHAIDRDFIAKNILAGFAKPATGPLVSPSPFYDPNVPRYAVDLAKANSLLDEAGYPRAAGGMRFNLSLDYETTEPEIQTATAEYVREQCKKIGVDIKLQGDPDFASWANRIGNLNYDLTLDEVFNYPDPVIGVARMYISSNIRKHIWTNVMGYTNHRVDALFDQAQREPNLAKRRALYFQVQDILATDLPILWLEEMHYITLYNRKVGGLPTGVWGLLSPLLDTYIKT